MSTETVEKTPRH